MCGIPLDSFAFGTTAGKATFLARLRQNLSVVLRRCLLYTSTGVGLGLYIVRTVIHLHGGEIHVSSKEGEYTEFAFSVPSAGTKNSQNLFRKNG